MRKGSLSFSVSAIFLCMKKIALFVMLTLVLLASCSPSVQQTRSREPLRNYETLVVRDISSNQGTSGSGGYLGSTGSGVLSANVLSAADAAQQAALSFAFELEFMGFKITNDLKQADAVVEFSIGTVRYDALAGWIADQAVARFVSAQSGEPIAAYRARTRLVTPTTSNLVGDLAEAIQESY